MENHASHVRNLKLLMWLRNVALAGQAAAIMVVTRFLDIPLDEKPLWIIIIALAAVNTVTFFRVKTATHIPRLEFLGQLLVDITGLYALLYYTGGATNPFAPLFILQVIIAAIILPPSYTWAVAALTITLYTALMFWSVEVPYFMHHHMGDFFSLHVQGMWISFILLAGIVAWFVVRMNITIKRQDALLAEAEKIAAIGTLAASAAHELGTPLATIAILAEDTPPEKAQQFSRQIARCKQIISRVTAAGGVIRAEGGAPMPLLVFLEQLLAAWQKERPETLLETTLNGKADFRIVAEEGLRQALINLLNNAADASPAWVRFEAIWTSQQLHITICDRGKGIAGHIQSSLGEIGITTKPDGLGLGLFLAKSVIHRLEGTLNIESSTTKGTIATISLPTRRLAL